MITIAKLNPGASYGICSFAYRVKPSGTNGSYSATVDGIKHINLVRVNLVSNDGDSGGIAID